MPSLRAKSLNGSFVKGMSREIKFIILLSSFDSILYFQARDFIPCNKAKIGCFNIMRGPEYFITTVILALIGGL